MNAINSLDETVRRSANLTRARVVPLKHLFSRAKTVSSGSQTLLSLYRDYGIVPKDSRDDNFNRASDDLSNYQQVNPGDLVVNKMKAWQGSVGISGYSGIISPAYFVYRPISEHPVRYFHYVFRSDVYRQAFGSISSGVRPNQWDLDPDAFGRLPVAVPPVRRAQTIADYLDHETAEIDAFITDHQALLAWLEERRAAAIHSSLEAGTFELVALKHLGSLRSGLTLGARYSGELNEYPYLRVANVQTDHVDLNDVARIPVPTDIAERNRLQPGDILMTEGGDRDKLGRGALWRGEIPNALHQNHIFSFRCGPTLSPEFLVLALESDRARRYFDETARQSTNLASTNSKTVKAFRLPWRPLAEQKRITAIVHKDLRNMADAMADSKRAIGLARERRAALISAAVTGQIDVTQKHRPVAEQLEDEVKQLH
ncbi:MULTISPECIES: hypothetical protein [Actinomycetes]|uniref:Type I restriction modification DNA specificity domain-containing protein n=2 Tax=Actinomycetes TaxID=1760 RepID=A0ABP6LV60_9MICC